MHSDSFFFQALIYLTAAVVSVPIAKRLGLGSVLGYLIAGMVIGPFGLRLIGEEGQDVMHFAEFGVIMMLFLVGLELKPSLLWRLRVPLLGLGGLQVFLTTLLITGISIGVGLPWQTSLAVGLILALSSTAMVLQTLTEKNLLKSDAGQNAFSVLLFQDVAVIPMLAVLPLLALKEVIPAAAPTGSQGLQALPGWAQTIAVLVAVGLVIFAGRYLVRPLLRAIAATRLRELFTATALLLVIGIAELMITVGLSPALGTFLAGVVLANSEYRHELEGNIAPFKGLLLGLFFIAVGSSLNFELIASGPTLIAVLVLTLVAVKFLVLFVLGRLLCTMDLDQNLLFSLALAQGGEFGFVLFSFAARTSVISGEITEVLIASVAVSMAVTPLVLLINEKLIQPRFGTHEREEGISDQIEEENQVIIAGFGRFGSVVGRLLRANGVSPTVLEYDSEHVEVLRRLGLKVYYGDATRLDLLEAAGAESARLLIIAIDDQERILEITELVKKHFPGLTILARASGRQEAYELLDHGIEHVYRETLDTSLRMGVDSLRLLGFRSFQAHRAANRFRKHDEAALGELMKLRHDRKTYLNVARQRIEDLEQILLAEVTDEGEFRDEGWDTDSLQDEYRQ